MFKIRRWRFGLVFLIACVLAMNVGFLGTTSTFAQTRPNQARFSDIQGHWAQACITSLTQLNGYPDGRFRPEAPVTRAEFAAMAVPAFPSAINATLPRGFLQFADVPANHWAAEAIQKAYMAEFFSGYPGNVFRPNQNITRAQVLVALTSGLNQSPSQPQAVTSTLNAAFSDAGSIPTYARNGIAAAIEKRWVVNYPNVRSLNPNRPASRAEVAAFLCQTAGSSQNLVPPQYIVTTAAPAFSQPVAQTTELRGVWLTNIDSEVLFSRSNLIAGLQRLADLNFNTVYPTVWNWGYTLYPSAVAASVVGRSLDPEPGLQNRDMLAEVVQQGHQRGMSVIPWVEFGLMAPADSQLALNHPDWITNRQDGSQIVMEGRFERVWLSPFHPQVQQFMVNLIAEIAENYDVDGVQLDDHFGLPVEMGYDEYAVRLYQQEHQGRLPPRDPRDPGWMRWRADKMTDLMTQVFQAVKARKPNCLISLSPNPQEFSYDYFLQDWHSWERRGLIEELIVQLYRNDMNVFVSQMNDPEVQAARNHIPVAIGILSGLKDRPVPMAHIQNQVRAVREQNLAGVSFFFYETLWSSDTETLDERMNVLKSLFARSVPRPNILTGRQA